MRSGNNVAQLARLMGCSGTKINNFFRNNRINYSEMQKNSIIEKKKMRELSYKTDMLNYIKKNPYAQL